MACADATDIVNKTAVIELQSKILNCLRRYSTKMYPDDQRRYGRILLRLPTLRVVSAKVTEKFLSMSLDGSIKMNDLVLELLS